MVILHRKFTKKKRIAVYVNGAEARDDVDREEPDVEARTKTKPSPSRHQSAASNDIKIAPLSIERPLKPVTRGWSVCDIILSI